MIRIPATAPKMPGSPDRCVSFEETAKHIDLLRSHFGITRVGDTTFLDRTGIPTFCAIVPKSPDILGVYNGKGRTPLASRLSALMEAFERQAAAHVTLPTTRVPINTVSDFLPIQHLELLPEALDETADCVAGTDLLSQETGPVPLALVRFPWRGQRLFGRSSTNGLASGNNLIEAIYHALTEMVERHVWSLFYVRSELVPAFFRGEKARNRVLAPALAFPTGNAYIDELYDTIGRSGLRVRVTVLRERSLPPVAIASVVEPQSHPPMAHLGLGCSLSPAHAVERAVTEAVQSRVVDVQAAREDIARADDPRPSKSRHATRPSRLPENSWFVDLPAPLIQLREIEDQSTNDLAVDIKTVLTSISNSGIQRVVAVDISPEGQPFAVVRIVCPDFETTAVDGRIGPLALAEFSPFQTRQIS